MNACLREFGPYSTSASRPPSCSRDSGFQKKVFYCSVPHKSPKSILPACSVNACACVCARVCVWVWVWVCARVAVCMCVASIFVGKGSLRNIGVCPKAETIFRGSILATGNPGTPKPWILDTGIPNITKPCSLQSDLRACVNTTKFKSTCAI